jgi:hypothetical protein
LDGTKLRIKYGGMEWNKYIIPLFVYYFDEVDVN